VPKAVCPTALNCSPERIIARRLSSSSASLARSRAAHAIRSLYMDYKTPTADIRSDRQVEHARTQVDAVGSESTYRHSGRPAMDHHLVRSPRSNGRLRRVLPRSGCLDGGE
jgi:hypothetical protein